MERASNPGGSQVEKSFHEISLYLFGLGGAAKRAIWRSKSEARDGQFDAGNRSPRFRSQEGAFDIVIGVGGGWRLMEAVTV